MLDNIEAKVYDFITGLCGKLDKDVYNKCADKITSALTEAITADSNADDWQLTDEAIDSIRGMW